MKLVECLFIASRNASKVTFKAAHSV